MLCESRHACMRPSKPPPPPPTPSRFRSASSAIPSWTPLPLCPSGGCWWAPPREACAPCGWGGPTPRSRRSSRASTPTPSCGAVAEAIGQPGAARAVARACAANPVALVIPCHRVVRGDGDTGGYRWGVARKRLLLEQERSAAQRAERRVLRDLIDATGGGTPGPVPAEGPLAAGQVLAGRYDIDRVLGAGGMGVVYAARDLELDEVVALKVLRAPSGSEDAAALDRFRHEVRITRRISHAHVVRTHDIGEAAGRRFITMEYVDGWSLAQLLERRGTLPLEATVVIGKQLCRALDVVHGQGVIHRDLKPQNILITRDGDVKLTDFGIAELDQPHTPESRAAGGPHGTLAYMAPEQLLGERIDARTDLYATAAVLCECLTGSPPYPATTPESLLARARSRRSRGAPRSPRSPNQRLAGRAVMRVPSRLSSDGGRACRWPSCCSPNSTKR